MSTWRQLKRNIARSQGLLDFKKKYKRHGLNQGVSRGMPVSKHLKGKTKGK